MLQLEEESGVLLSVDLLLQSSSKTKFQVKYYQSQTFTPSTFGDTRSVLRLKRFERLREAVSVRVRPVDLTLSVKAPPSSSLTEDF